MFEEFGDLRIGYACQVIGVADTMMRRCMMKNATAERLTDLIYMNLRALENILDYNIQNEIRLFRISSDLIPFGSSPVNKLPWRDMFEAWLITLGKKILSNGIRVSMHPGQYTVLNSIREDTVQRAMEDLEYHANVLDSLGVGSEHKIILHVGGLYEDKQQAMNRFIFNYQRLSQPVRNRLVLENDDKCFTVYDVLEISGRLQIPVIYDTLHDAVNPGDSGKSNSYWIDLCSRTWKTCDGPQKIHYSHQAAGKSPGSHSETIHTDAFLEFYQSIGQKELDIMLEVKDKNVSALKCIRAIQKIQG